MSSSLFSAEDATGAAWKALECPSASNESHVLHEQLEYLITHSQHAQGCKEQCPECQRLASVKQVLMTLWSSGATAGPLVAGQPSEK